MLRGGPAPEQFLGHGIWLVERSPTPATLKGREAGRVRGKGKGACPGGAATHEEGSERWWAPAGDPAGQACVVAPPDPRWPHLILLLPCVCPPARPCCGACVLPPGRSAAAPLQCLGLKGGGGATTTTTDTVAQR